MPFIITKCCTYLKTAFFALLISHMPFNYGSSQMMIYFFLTSCGYGVPGLSPWTSPQDQTAADPCRPTSAGSREMWRRISWYKEPRAPQWRETVMMSYRDRERERQSPFVKQLSFHSGRQLSNKIVLLQGVAEIFLQSIHLWTQIHFYVLHVLSLSSCSASGAKRSGSSRLFLNVQMYIMRQN